MRECVGTGVEHRAQVGRVADTSAKPGAARAFAGVWRVIVICLLVLARPGWGQNSSDDLTSLSLEELTQITLSTASRHLEDPRKAPSSVTTITGEEITRQGWRTMAEVLRSVRGFYTAYDRNYTYVGVRGFLQSGDFNARILLLVNGHRINENIYDSALLGSEFPLDLALIERIEIVRGPSSSLYGTNAVLGVVNVITRRPERGASIEVSGETASFLGRKGRLTGTLERGRFSALVSGTLFATPGQESLFYPEFASPETNNGFAENVDGDRYAQQFTDVRYRNWRVQGLYSSRRKIIPTGSYETTFNDPANRTIDSRGYLDLSYAGTIGHETQMDLRAYYDAYRFRGAYAYGAIGSPDYSVQMNDAVADWIGFEGTLAHRFGRHRVVGGAVAEYNLRLDQKNYYVGEPEFLNTHQTPLLVAPYGEVEWNLTSTLAVNTGARVDWYNKVGVAFSPRIAVMYLPSARTSLKYIFGHAFRAPDAYDVYFVDTIEGTPPDRRLKPEDLHAHMVVFEHSLKPWLAVTVEGFHNRLDLIIKQDWDPETGETVFGNGVGDIGHGVEVELAMKRASGWAARASYTSLRTHDQSNDRATPNSPSHVAKLSAAMPLAGKGFAGFELLYAGSQHNYAGVHVSPSLLANATLSSKPFWGGWQLSASCYNVFNRTWYTPTGPDLTQTAVQQDGRMFRFGLSRKISFRPERSGE